MTTTHHEIKYLKTNLQRNHLKEIYFHSIMRLSMNSRLNHGWNKATSHRNAQPDAL